MTGQTDALHAAWCEERGCSCGASETRLAQALRTARAEAWDEGYAAGENVVTFDANGEPNPYRDHD